MFRSRLSASVAAALCLGLISTGFAQNRTRKESASPANSPREQVNQRFNQSTPEIGAALPDVSAFDADGNAFKLQSIKGNHSVLVFGCLT